MLRVRIKPEGNFGNQGANHDPVSIRETHLCFGGVFKLPLMGKKLSNEKCSMLTFTSTAMQLAAEAKV